MSDVATELDQLRIALGEIRILATLTKRAFDNEEWNEPDPDIVDGIASLLGLIDKSAIEAMAAFHVLHAAVADAAPAPATAATERWDYDKGTSPGKGDEPAMSAEDAAIVRRIREMCPDGRFDGGTDAELIQLFKRNKQVLSRSDEDVIAAMTHPR